MFYKYAHFILIIIGILIGLAECYFDRNCSVDYRELLWAGFILILAIEGFIIGSLIRKLSISSHTDFLTGLGNRRYFHLKLDKEKARALKKKTSLCVAMIDVDDFKIVNDTFGHTVGDKIIADLAATLKKNTRSADVVIRWGGDEFAIIFPETALAEAYGIMEQIRHEIEARFHSTYGLTISGGVVVLEPDQDLEDLIIKADQTLYKAKTEKNSVITMAN